MKEYIEREAVRQAHISASLTTRLIDAQPAADVAPVVRCRDCKFYREFRTKRYNQLMRLCCRMGKRDMEYPVNSVDFCSYGQRKETDHEVSEP